MEFTGNQRTLAFTLSEMGRQWRTLCRSDIFQLKFYEDCSDCCVENRLQGGKGGSRESGQAAAAIIQKRDDGGLDQGGGMKLVRSDFDHNSEVGPTGFSEGLVRDVRGVKEDTLGFSLSY